jgi:hypothetical protein
VRLSVDPAFAEFERLSAMIDQDMAFSARSEPARVGSLEGLFGVSDEGVCTRSVEIDSFGPANRPRVVTHESGACGKGAGAPDAPRGVSQPSARPMPAAGRFQTVSNVES